VVDERELPPVALLATVSLGLVVIGGILMASFVPRRPPLVVPIVLLVAATIVYGVAVVLLVRIERFAWTTFAMVFKWALLAYVISAGMIAFAFIRNHTRGGPLTVTLLMLVIFALSVPMTIAYTVARFTDT
jgi:hypothetical protein